MSEEISCASGLRPSLGVVQPQELSRTPDPQFIFSLILIPPLCLAAIFVLLFFSIVEALPFAGTCSYGKGHSYLPDLPQEVAAIGAPVTGSLIEGRVGSMQNGGRRRFYCNCATPKEGFLGPQTTLKPMSLKDQPGVFPAPLVGPASLTFSFGAISKEEVVSLQALSSPNPDIPFTPVIIKPDGTVCKGFPMTASHSPQTIVVSSPAQTGVYTLFIATSPQIFQTVQADVQASISTQPEQKQVLHLQSLNPYDGEAALVSAEFIYINRY